MIARLMRALRRRLLEADIKDMEADLEGIAEQRKNDDEAEKLINGELVIARRQLQAMIQEDVQQSTADLLRRMRP